MRAFKGKSARLRTVLLIGIAALLAAAVIGATVGAKYVKEIRIPCTLIIRAGLADKVSVLEHEPLRQPDGTYQLDQSKEVSESEFVLMPGVDAARDPFVRIERKTDIPAFVYVEVVSTLGDKAGFTLTNAWEKLDGVTGQNGGEVYAFEDMLSSDNKEDIELPLFEDEAVTVSHTYIAAGEAETNLSFYPYMAKAEEGKTAEECFDKNKIGFGDTGKYTPAPQGKVTVDGDGKAVVGDIGYTVYVRAAVIANWRTEDGSIYGKNAEKGTNYTFTIGSGWFKAGDGYYYYSNPVESGGETSALITDFTVLTDAPNGCSLSLDISAEIIQESGSTDNDNTPTVTAVWGCRIGSDRVITK